MEMKQKTANLCVGLLFFVFAFGLHQAWQQNRNPFAKNTYNDVYISDITVSNNHFDRLHKESNDFFKSSIE